MAEYSNPTSHPISVKHGGDTYIVPPGETLRFDEPEPKAEVPIAPAPEGSEDVEAPKEEQAVEAPASKKGRKRASKGGNK